MANLDEQHLNDVLTERVAGARVVKITGQGFWALIPHFRSVDGEFSHFTLGNHYLGETYTESLAMLNRCWQPKE